MILLCAGLVAVLDALWSNFIQSISLAFSWAMWNSIKSHKTLCIYSLFWEHGAQNITVDVN